ncbi:MAG TPA: M28 family metallopeptidase, partial [Thermomicrobiales bacterium]|nr:M28 family metallopeptidase [Thermomicrobiales bacterium]
LLLIRLIGGGEKSPAPEATPTPTATSVILQPGSGSESTPVSTEPSGQSPPLAPTETPEVRRGGDNQIGGGEGTPASGSQGTTLTPGAESPLAKECSDRCLVRVEDDNVAQVMSETGNRPSFSVDNLAWVVATPDQVSLLDERADVAFVEDSDETLHLYVVKVPAGGDASLVKDYATVLDSSGPYQLVRFDELPARVSTLANKSFDISKMAPPPVASIQETEVAPIEDESAGALMGQVSDTNIANIITTLQASGSTDGTGMGTRYYTYGGNQIAADYLYQQLESYGLNVWFEEFLSPEGILLVNVVGEAPGRDNSAIYAMMAHLDSINVEASPSTAPGADDNGTGMAAILEMARILAQYRLEHPVRFVFVNGEEVGILGSAAWAKRTSAENVPIEGVFNIDSVGSDRQGRLLVFNSDEGSAWMQDLMISVNDGYGLGQEIMSRKNPSIVADDNMVRDQGYEAVMIARELYGWSPVHHSARDVESNVSIENVMTTAYVVMLSTVALVSP